MLSSRLFRVVRPAKNTKDIDEEATALGKAEMFLFYSE